MLSELDKQKLHYLIGSAKMYVRHAKKFIERGYEGPNHWIKYTKEHIEKAECILNERNLKCK